MTEDKRPRLAIIHGWGFDKGVFSELSLHLQQDFHLQLIDLPGYGTEAGTDNYTLDDLAGFVERKISGAAIIAGWSMGGLVAMTATRRFPEKFRHLVLLSTTPCFVQKPDWPYAMKRKVLENFIEGYNKEPQETMDKFSYLTTAGSPDARNWLRELKKRNTKRPSTAALEKGLQLLLASDLREDLKWIEIPALMLFAEHDSLVPVAVAEEISKLNEAIEIRVLKEAGHAPFLTHAEEIAALIKTHVNLGSTNAG